MYRFAQRGQADFRAVSAQIDRLFRIPLGRSKVRPACAVCVSQVTFSAGKSAAIDDGSNVGTGRKTGSQQKQTANRGGVCPTQQPLRWPLARWANLCALKS